MQHAAIIWREWRKRLRNNVLVSPKEERWSRTARLAAAREQRHAVRCPRKGGNDLDLFGNGKVVHGGLNPSSEGWPEEGLWKIAVDAAILP